MLNDDVAKTAGHRPPLLGFLHIYSNFSKRTVVYDLMMGGRVQTFKV
ncbi:hypothetical protein ABIB48_000486 [Arthrobacter sp. UYCu511]